MLKKLENLITSAAFEEAEKNLSLEGLHMKFVKVGTRLTSVDIKGVSLSLLKVADLDWVT